MAEIQSGNKGDVEAFLLEWFVRDSTDHVDAHLRATADEVEPPPRPLGLNISAERASDYAEIAVFLSTQDRWKPELEKISKLLREHFLTALLIGRTNAFMSAISMIASRIGFPTTDHHLVLAGFTNPNTFRGYVRDGRFWKDAVSSYHGEHSHSIQWLALAMAWKDGALNIKADISTLYKESVEYACKKRLYHASGNEYRSLYLWDWLVDCFDYGNQAADFTTNITSETPRSPSYLNKYIFEQGETVGNALWIGQYLKARHNKRAWPLPAVDRTDLKQYAILSAGNKNRIAIAENRGGNFVYKVDTSKADNPRLKRIRTAGAEYITLKMTKFWSGAVFVLDTSLNYSFPIKEVKYNKDDKNFKSLKIGQPVNVKVQIAQKTEGNGFEVKVV
jgi:hypothetical protein